MARTLSVVVLAAAVASMLEVYAQEDAFYIADGRRISLPAAQRSSAVRIVEGRLDEFQAAVEKEPAVTLVPLPLLQQRYGIAFLGAAEGVEDEVFRRAVAVLEEHPAVESAVPVYRSGDVELVLVNEFTVRFEPDVPLETGRELLERLGADVLEIDERRSRFTVTFPREEPDAALRYINELAVDPRTRYAQPSLVRVLPPRIGFLEIPPPPTGSRGTPTAEPPPETASSSFPRCPSPAPDAVWTGSPNDALFARQWSLRHTTAGRVGGAPGADIRALAGWQVSQGSADVTIAVLDLGVSSEHPDLKSKIVPGADVTGAGTTEPLLDDHHGTSIAGVAAAASNNAVGIAGVDWHARVAPVRVSYSGCATGDCRWEWAPTLFVDGIYAAIDLGARVLIGAWGWHGDPDDGLSDAIREAVEANAVVVLAAGQHQAVFDADTPACATGEDRSVFYPANLAGSSDPILAGGVIAVSATDQWDDFQVHQCEDPQAYAIWGSNRGPEVSLSAPGTDILSLTNYGGYACYFGTSMSAPLVAGAAALLLARYPDATPAEIKRWLQEGADYLGSDPTGRDDRYGHGRLNLAGAFEAAAADRGSSQE